MAKYGRSLTLNEQLLIVVSFVFSANNLRAAGRGEELCDVVATTPRATKETMTEGPARVHLAIPTREARRSTVLTAQLRVSCPTEILPSLPVAGTVSGFDPILIHELEVP